MGQLQAKTGEIPTLDDALKELLENYKKKSRRYNYQDQQFVSNVNQNKKEKLS